MKIKIFALVLVIALLACGLASCAEPTQTEETPTPTAQNTLEPTEDPQKLARGDARGALSTYLANTSSEQTGVVVEEGTVFVVEKFGKWYSFPFIDGQLTDGDITDTAPTTPEGLVLANEADMTNIPENVTIYIPKS